MSEKPTHEQRIAVVEHWKSWINGAFGAWVIILTLTLGFFCWYMDRQVQNLDGNRISVAALVTSMEILSSTVTDNVLQIRGINERIRDLEISNQLLNAKMSSVESRAAK